MTDNERKSEYTSKWAANESLLQSYRVILISSQSFLLAAGAFLSNKNHFYVFVLSAVLGILAIWCIWYPIVVIRHRIVDYNKYASKIDAEKFIKLLDKCDDDVYATDPKKREETNLIFNIDTNWRKTRIKLDRYLPILFTILWGALLIEQVILNYESGVKKYMNPTSLVIVGLLLNLVGAIILASGLFLSKKRAIKLGVSRYSGGTEGDQLKLPQVQDRLKQSRNAKCGVILLALGFLLQVIANLL